ncbi:MAG: ATP-binding protein, partial [Gemmatimonadaceae bacterium]
AEQVLARQLGAERIHTLEAVFHHTPSFLAVLRGPDNVFEIVNAAYYQIVGHRDLVGLPLFEAIPETRGQGFDTCLGRVRETGEPLVFRDLPVLLERTPGAEIEERFVDITYLPLDGTLGPQSAVIAHGMDVTDRVRARRDVEQLLAATEQARADAEAANAQLLEQALELELTNQQLQDNATELEQQTEEAGALSEELEQTNEQLARQVAEGLRSAEALREIDARLQFALDATQLGTWDLDLVTMAAGRTQLHDRAFGYETMLPEWSYPIFLEHVHPDDRAEVDRKFQHTVATSAPWNFECRVIWPDNTVHWIIAFSAAYRDTEGQPIRLLGSVQDVTERVNARLAAEVANAAKSQFLAAMSHELRTPLNAIGGYTELLEMELRGPITQQQRVDLERIRRSQQYLLGLINDVLNFAKLDAGQVEYHISAVPVDAVVRETEAMITPQIYAKGMDYSYSGCDPALTVRADREKVQQVLLNLLSNAAKFTAAGGDITVSCETAQSGISIRVHDTGAGIAAEKLEGIFEPFMQVERRLNRPGEGVGLGLAISRELARAMGGDLTVESEPGVGSTFNLTLPSGEEKPPEAT